ncbi:CoA transferase [Roseomonas sp. E05]|uniref:CaiB/BaiF CoA transferase family protein n=1 Tax=Roseomonas sp. E05 TaxID=3046310 RepID=UPI0024BB63B2|nr:CoA transferase [Roseomonas sp. E05]MDJ0389572.1 CoA transferase [Roseomonas sp. E05]
MSEEMRPYRGLRVLDASQGIAGPYCGMLLAASGAEVVKLEPPGGDWSRGLSTRANGQSVMHVTFNRGKRSIVLDLKQAEGRATAQALAARADVLIEAFRPGVAARLGLGPEATPEDAICLSISGFGQQGPYAGQPCTDSVAQGFSGLAALNPGPDGAPHKVGTLVADVVTGLSAFAAVQAALAQRMLERGGAAPPQRRVLDVSLMAGMAGLLAMPLAEAGLLGRAPAALNLPAGSYQAADGAWVMVALVRETEFVALCEVLGLPELPHDPRFASFAARAEHREALLPLVRAAFTTRPAEDWLARLGTAGLLASRVNTPLDWLADPHVQAVGAAAPLRQPEMGELPMPALPGFGHWLAPAPALGAHTAEILRELAIPAR